MSFHISTYLWNHCHSHDNEYITPKLTLCFFVLSRNLTTYIHPSPLFSTDLLSVTVDSFAFYGVLYKYSHMHAYINVFYVCAFFSCFFYSAYLFWDSSIQVVECISSSCFFYFKVVLHCVDILQLAYSFIV